MSRPEHERAFERPANPARRRAFFRAGETLLAAATLPSLAQGPTAPIVRAMHGFADQQGMLLWLQGSRAEALTVEVRAGEDLAAPAQTFAADLHAPDDFATVVPIAGLEPGTAHHYTVRAADGAVRAQGRFATQPLWQWRTDPPTVRIATGSCNYLNDFHFDRPGAPYGGGEEIFDTIAGLQPDLMLWLGDNIYLREPEYTSREGINRRYRFYRAHARMAKLLTAAPHVAIWDDHDFGPNDSDASYSGRGWTLEMFRRYWPIPYSTPGDGLYGAITQGDVDLFLLDDRSYRDPDDWAEGADKVMYGKKQLDWLKRALVYSRAPFKLICGGSQFFNGVSRYETWARYPAEQKDLLDFLAARKVPGVIFLSGDRHFSEALRIERPSLYPVHEFTVSPFTAGLSKPDAAERANPLLVPGSMLTERNFAMITVSGPRRDRRLALELFDTKGAKRYEWSTSAAQLAAPKTAG